jgi:hypothetical protein
MSENTPAFLRRRERDPLPPLPKQVTGLPRQAPSVTTELPAHGEDINFPADDQYAPAPQRERASAIARALEQTQTNMGKEISRTPLQEIYARMCKLTYGELKQYCEATGGDIEKVWDGCTKNEPQDGKQQ